MNPSIKTAREKKIFVPEELNSVIEIIKERMAGFSIEIKSVESIHYGKKFVFALQEKWAEVNVFYGKKGFSAVKTPKQGSNAELADIAHQIICEMLLN